MSVVNRNAYVLRENTGTTGLEQTARTAAEILAHFEVPHLIVGGFAVQEHGYARVTLDVDIVVPDVMDAVELLTADVAGPFRRVSGCEDRVQDSRNGVPIDLLPGGRVLKHGCAVPFPFPGVVSDLPRIASLSELISLKLDSWRSTPVRRLRDKTDVIELISRRGMPWDFAVAAPVQELYWEIWDALQNEA